MSAALVLELRRRLPVFADLGTPLSVGDPRSYVEQDRVSAVGPASVVELFTQLLGKRVSATFMVAKLGGGITTLWLDSAYLVGSAQLSSPTKTLRQLDDTVQLKLMGTLRDGTRQNLTQGECGTEYAVSDPNVLAVSGDGLLRAVGKGEARVMAVNENVGDWMFN